MLGTGTIRVNKIISLSFKELNSLYGRHILITLPPSEPLITLCEKHYERKDMGTMGKNSILANIY